ncbi:MAG: ornithine cyclodeaminase [Chloroflexia bacterium]|nr:ornithine cyclodeaminase [Chloroflexia bacterium]
MLALTRNDVRRLVPMADAIDLMKVAFRELSAGTAVAPLRTAIEVSPSNADMLLMPAFVPAVRALGFKVVSVVRDNPSRGLPTINALVCLIDDVTGAPLAIMDGTYLTALRTGAVSGAATDLLARQDARTLVIIGAGAQGVTQAVAVCTVRPIERILVVDPSSEALHRYQDTVTRDWPDLAARVELTSDAGAAVPVADVICTATTSNVPVFDDADIKPGTHINAIGAYTPAMQEIPPATVTRAVVVVDQIEAALAEAGDLIKPLELGLVGRDHFSRELGTLVNGSVAGRESDEHVTLFKSVGNAVQDVVVARRAVEQAEATGAGQTILLT